MLASVLTPSVSQRFAKGKKEIKTTGLPVGHKVPGSNRLIAGKLFLSGCGLALFAWMVGPQSITTSFPFMIDRPSSSHNNKFLQGELSHHAASLLRIKSIAKVPPIREKCPSGMSFFPGLPRSPAPVFCRSLDFYPRANTDFTPNPHIWASYLMGRSFAQSRLARAFPDLP